MRRIRWFLGLMLISGMVATPLLTVWAQDATPAVVNEPIPTATDPDVVETVAPESTATSEPVNAEPTDASVFSAAAVPVLTVGGSSDSPVSIPFGGQATVAVSGLDSSMQVFFYTAPVGCPQDDTSRVMLFGAPLFGNAGFSRTNSPGTTEYLQAQLYGGTWSNCIQVNWGTAPTATATSAPTDLPTVPSGPGAMSFTVNGYTSGTLTVNPDDLVTVHAVNVSTLIIYGLGACAGPPVVPPSGVMLDAVVSHPASEWTHTPVFSMQAHGMDSSTGNCITVNIMQPAATTAPTDTATVAATATNTATATATATATQQALVLTANGSTTAPVHVPGGTVATMLVSGLTPGGTVAYGYSQAGCPASVALPGMQGPFAVGVDGTYTFQAAGNAGATWYYQAQQNGVWSNCLQLIWGATFNTPTATPLSPYLFVNDDDAAVVHINYPTSSVWLRWHDIPRLNAYPSADCSGIPVTSFSVSGYGNDYRPSRDWATLIGGNVFSLQGFAPPSPEAITGCHTVILDNAPSGTATATATTTSTATIAPTATATAIATATATATATAPVVGLTVNGLTDPTVTVNSTDAVSIVTTNVPFLGLFKGPDCVTIGQVWENPDTLDFGAADLAVFANTNAVSVQGFATSPYDGGLSITTCRTIQIAFPPTATATTVPPTPTATATLVPSLTINGVTDSTIHADYFTQSVTLAWSGVPELEAFPNGTCSGSTFLTWSSGSGSQTYTSGSWGDLAGGAIFSVRGFTAVPGSGGTPVTDCRVVIIDNVPPTPTSTTAPTETAISTATAADTATATATATATPGSLLTVNGFPDDVVHVWVNGTLTIVWQNIPYLLKYQSANCTGVGSLIGSNAGANSDSGANWKAWANNAPVFSILGQAVSDAGGPAVTNCRTIYLDTDPPTATPTPLLTINGSTADLQHVALSSQVYIVATGIRYVSFYFGTGCTGTNYFNGTDLNGTGQFYSIPAANVGWPQNGGFSIQGFTSAGGTVLTTCRSVAIDMPIPTATAGPSPTETNTVAPTSTATTEPTNTVTTVPTETATIVPTDTVEPTATETALPTATTASTNTPVPLTDPPLTIDGVAQSTTVAISAEVHALTESNAKINYWYAADCSGDPIGTLPGFSSWVSWNSPMVVSFQAARNLDPSKVSTCLTVTWADIATETPVPTDTFVPTNTATATIEPTATETAVPTSTATEEPPTATATNTAAPTATVTLAPTATSTETPTVTSTAIPTNTATVETVTATTVPTNTVTTEPTNTATSEPTATVGSTQTATATEVPSTAIPTATTVSPTATLTPAATVSVGTVQIQLTTSDGGNIPAGTTWLLSAGSAIGSPSGTGHFFAAQIAGAQGGTLAISLPSGSLLPIANPIAFGTYALTIDAPGYEAVVETIDVSEAETSVTVRLIATPAVTATITATVTNAPTSTATSVPEATPAVSVLPKTGTTAGNEASQPWPLLLLTIAGAFAIAGAALGFPMRRR